MDTWTKVETDWENCNAERQN